MMVPFDIGNIVQPSVSISGVSSNTSTRSFFIAANSSASRVTAFQVTPWTCMLSTSSVWIAHGVSPGQGEGASQGDDGWETADCLTYGTVVVLLLVVVLTVGAASAVTVVVVVGSRTKPHFLPLLFGAGFFGFFLWGLCVLHGFLECGIPPLSAELKTGKAAAIPRQVTNTASLRVLTFTWFTSMVSSPPTSMSAAEGAGVRLMSANAGCRLRNTAVRAVR